MGRTDDHRAADLASALPSRTRPYTPECPPRGGGSRRPFAPKTVVSYQFLENTGVMDTVLWQTLAGTRGGPNRARILRALDERPRNANQLAEEFDLAYNTIRHHLDVLEENGVVTSGQADYGTIYLPSDRTRSHWDTVEEIVSQLED